MGIIPGLLAGGAAAALFLGRSEYEKDCLVTDTYEICSPKLTEGGRTLVFLTDLHDKEFGPGNRRLLETIRAGRAGRCPHRRRHDGGKGEGRTGNVSEAYKALAGGISCILRQRQPRTPYEKQDGDLRKQVLGIQGGPGKNGGRPCFRRPCMPGQGSGPLRGGPGRNGITGRERRPWSRDLWKRPWESQMKTVFHSPGPFSCVF